MQELSDQTMFHVKTMKVWVRARMGVCACESQIKTLRVEIPELWICAHFASRNLIKVSKQRVIFPSFLWLASLAADTQGCLYSRPSHGIIKFKCYHIHLSLRYHWRGEVVCKRTPPSFILLQNNVSIMTQISPLILFCFLPSQVRGKSQTGRQTWLPPSSVHWLQATSSRLPSPTSYWLSTASDAGLPTPTWSAGLQTASCSCTVSPRHPSWLQTTGTPRPITVCLRCFKY